MKPYFNLLLIVLVGLSIGCARKAKTTEIMQTDNPFYQASTLQYQAPQFDKIKLEHFKPAFDEGMKVHMAEIDSIANSAEPATFENTLVALEKSGELLRRAQTVFYNFTSALTNPDLQKLEEEYAPVFSAHSDAMYLNDKLFERIRTVYENRETLTDPEDRKLVEKYYQRFEMAGATLTPENKEVMKKLNAEEATLMANFTSKLLAATKAGGIYVTDKAALDGLSEDEIAVTAQAAKDNGKDGQYYLALTNTTQQPLLTVLKNRDTREKLFKASWTRNEKGDANDTRAIAERLAKIRFEKAKLLGKRDFASWKLQDQMAQTPEAVRELLKKLGVPAKAMAAREAADIQKLIDEQGGGFKLEPWDWNFYAEQVRKAKYNLDENEIKPYLEANTVMEKGVLFAAEKLYGITFKPRPDLPVYHPDVKAYEIFDANGESMALFYLDFFARDGKSGGAWMSNYVEQSHILNQKPVVVNVLNYQKPVGNNPILISWDDVGTMFHEFGHALHGLFANQKYITLSGTNVARDFVELPSQINEHWMTHPEVIKNYAVHYQTGEPMPQELIDKIEKASTFNQGYAVSEVVAASLLDLEWHSITDTAQVIPALDFEKKALEKNGMLIKEVPPRYHTPYFLHIWANGYNAGYYAYQWAEVLDSHAAAWMDENGGLTRANGDRFRNYVLSVGNAVDLGESFKEFVGKDPDITPMLKKRGLL